MFLHCSTCIQCVVHSIILSFTCASLSVIRQVQQGGSNRALDDSIEVHIPDSSFEDSYEMRRPANSFDSEDLEFPDFEWERDDRRHSPAPSKRSLADRASSQSPRHVQKNFDNGASSDGLRRQSSPKGSPLHSRSLSPSLGKHHRNASLDLNKLHPGSATMPQLNDQKRALSGSMDTLKVSPLTYSKSASDATQTENGASARRKGMQRAHGIGTADLG